MPSAKRAQQRAAKQAKQAEIERKRHRQRSTRTAIAVVVIAAIGVGIYFATSSSSSKPAAKVAAAKPPKSTKSSSTTSSSSPAAEQAAADKAAVAAGCPSSPSAALHKPTYSSAPAMTIDTSSTYTATVQTDIGPFTIALDASTAPLAVNNFVFLADHDYFNCESFMRVIPGFVDQAGSPTNTNSGSPGYQFTEHGPTPTANAADQYPLGSVAMANSSSGSTDPSTNGSQFFIVTGASGESLPPDYVLFGHVTSGMSVVQKINQQGATSGTPTVVHRMLKVTIATS